jgi:hypothetical protein
VPGSFISVSINKQRLVSNVEDSIRFHSDVYQLRQYTQAKHQWSDAMWHRLDFESFGRFYKKLPTADHQNVFTKYMFDHMSVGTNRYKTAKVKDEAQLLCPCCRTAMETSDHLLQCQSNSTHTESMQLLRKALRSLDNHPTLRLLSEGLCHWISEAAYSVLS